MIQATETTNKVSADKKLAWLDDWLDSYAQAITASDAAAWMPFDWSLLRPYYSDLFLEKLTEARKRARASPEKQAAAQKAFYGPLLLQLLMQQTLFDVKATRRARESEALETLNWIRELFYNATVADHYNLKSVQTLTPAEVERVLESREWSEGSENAAHAVGRLVNSCSQFGWGVYSDYYYSAWCHVQGPYALPRNREKSQNRCLVARLFPNFDAGEVWPDLAGFKPRSVEILTVYEDAEIEIDMWNHLKTKTFLPRALREYSVVVDGETVNDALKIKAFADKIGVAAAAHYEVFKQLDLEEQKRKFVTLEAFGYSRLFEALGMDWRENSRVLERIAGKPLLDEKAFYASMPKDKRAQVEWWKRLLDARDEFFPEGFHCDEVVK